MPLESLLALVEKLRKRIDSNDRELRKNEWLTRYALIDPLLRELGWDTEDPALVIPEYNVGDGSAADYALLSEGKPVMMVEAKSLGTPLQDAREQGLRYCMIKRTRYLSITDGERWEIYCDTDKTGDPGKKRLVQFDLKNRPATEACLRALTLWELRESGHVATSQESPTPDAPATPSPDKQKWHSLSKLNPERGARPPVEIQFPDNSVVSVATWRSLLAKVATWLIDNNHLTQSHCPIRKTTRSKKYIVHTEPVHEDGSKFYTPTPHQIGLLYVHRFGSPRANTNACRTIIERVGQDLAQFKVGFSPPRT